MERSERWVDPAWTFQQRLRYDARGRLVERVEDNRMDGHRKTTWTHEYRDDGQLARTRIHEEGYQPCLAPPTDYEVRYRYDRKGRVIERIRSRSSKPLLRWSWTY